MSEPPPPQGPWVRRLLIRAHPAVPSLTAECQEVVDLCIIVDSSGSIRDNNPSDGSYDNWDLLLQFVREVRRGSGLLVLHPTLRVGGGFWEVHQPSCCCGL